MKQLEMGQNKFWLLKDLYYPTNEKIIWSLSKAWNIFDCQVVQNTKQEQGIKIWAQVGFC
jgi:hypothetical protein